ncbi:type VI secretion system-associated protein VasI [Marinobacter sp. JSM 1782161]|uniref:type VI secretion system-associated protein VasI n=1 Tax=Marinobacter sp. JSM 1782161 TaxID=2685906 RepID=UPI001403E40F|nr:type VI secretion system-associated protein VasI [Marinobacter sp. JSM 1782161]
MTTRPRLLMFAAALAAVSGITHAAGSDHAKASGGDTLTAAQACTAKVARLERLACFDDVFDTPVRTLEEQQAALPAKKPAVWVAAYAQEQARTPEDNALQHDGDAGKLVTVPALGAVPPRPLLTVRCHNDITRFALMLPKASSAERVPLELDADGRMQAQTWRVRDDGYVISGGRGLPAIRTVRQLVNAQRLTLHSDESALDGLMFDLSGFRQALAPLRAECGW